jgi:hypothetical protein
MAHSPHTALSVLDMRHNPASSLRRRLYFPLVGVVGFCILTLSGPSAASRADALASREKSKRGAEEALQASHLSVTSEGFRFVGASTDGLPQESLSTGDTMLLAVMRRSASLDDVLDQGVPFQTDQIQRLQGWGVLEQIGIEFQALVPMLLEEDADSLRSQLSVLTPQIVEALTPELERLYRVLEEIGQEGIFAATLTWVLQERGWHYLTADPTTDLPGLVEQQRREYPDRGWWGILWYTGSSRQAVGRPRSVRSQQRMLLLDGVSEPSMSNAPDGGITGLATDLLAQLDDDAEEVRREEDFPNLIAAELLDDRGRLLFPVLVWDPDNPESPAAAVEATAEALAREILARLPVAELQPFLGTMKPVTVATISYVDLAPELYTTIMASERFLPDGPATDAPRPSAILWLDLPQGEPAFAYPW